LEDVCSVACLQSDAELADEPYWCSLVLIVATRAALLMRWKIGYHNVGDGGIWGGRKMGARPADSQENDGRAETHP
jgi:hypothetical protein